MYFIRLAAVLALHACCGSAPPPAPATPAQAEALSTPPPAPPPAPVVIAAPVGSNGAPATYRNQPPQLKLKLGHYANTALGIGVTIDLSEHIDNVAAIVPAKVRFDGDSKVWRLTGQHASHDRIDYIRDGGGLMLVVWRDGRRAVYVPDPETGKWSDEIEVVRDGDADPL